MQICDNLHPDPVGKRSEIHLGKVSPELPALRVPFIAATATDSTVRIRRRRENPRHNQSSSLIPSDGAGAHTIKRRRQRRAVSVLRGPSTRCDLAEEDAVPLPEVNQRLNATDVLVRVLSPHRSSPFRTLLLQGRMMGEGGCPTRRQVKGLLERTAGENKRRMVSVQRCAI